MTEPVDAEPAPAERQGSPARDLLRRHAGLLTASGLALAWLLVARRRSEATFHFAPFLVAAGWGAARRAVDAAPAGVAAGLAAAAGGLAVVAVTAAELAWVGALDGPTLEWFPDARVETAVFALLGAVLGFRFVTRRRPGLLFTG